MEDMILVGDLPADFTDGVGRDLSQYTVAFLRMEGSDAGTAELAGSGVLVSAGGAHAILTAQHVVYRLPRSGRLGLFLGQTNQPHTIDTEGVSFMEIARGRKDADGPDLGALVLGPDIAASIAAKKTFYNLDAHRQQALETPPDLRDGVWFANGFLAERSIVTTDGAGSTKWFYNFSAFGGPEVSPQAGEYDYFEFPVSDESKAGAPADWGGMSGCGLWQVQMKRKDGTIVPSAQPLLSGIVFYHWPPASGRSGVRAHGRRTVYEIARKKILGL